MNGDVLVNGIDMKNLVLGYRVGLFWKVLLPSKRAKYLNSEPLVQKISKGITELSRELKDVQVLYGSMK